ncbi:MAG TPA: LptF/LptG family permease [Kiritimatiellia bacterium]|nr:LptF/LptG family permease [Kiritimatiellia bacterium]HPS08131.1 LptF/LptG family permease [Kiritimatiellia bacterium]
MKIIERYVLQSFLTAFFLAWLVISFVLTIGLLVKLMRLIIEGLPVHAIGLYMLVGFPETLTLTLPLALLVSALLVFSRLSADSEIAAMRACGINLLHVMKWPAVFGAVLTLLGFYVNNEIVPRSHEIRSNVKSVISVDVGLDLLEPGRMIDDFPGFKVFFQKKEGNWLADLLVFDYTHPGMTREIRAEKALVSTNGADVVLDMYKVRVDPIDVEHPGVAVADRYRHVIPNAVKTRTVKRKEKDQRFVELRQTISDLRANVKGLPRKVNRKLLSVSRTEYHLRFVYACASICFVLVGMPLGIRAHRKESTIGMAVSLVVAMAFYLCVILFHSLDKFPDFQPYALLWIPVAACVAFAAFLIRRNL